MPRQTAFTLVEMLAVVAIMLILMVATFGMFNLFAERVGPESTAATLQALMSGARDYAASNSVYTRVVFRCTDSAGTADGSILTIEYLPPGSTSWASGKQEIRGRSPLALHNQMYVMKEIPSLSVTVPAVPSDPKTLTPDQIKAWRDYDKGILDAVTAHALSGGTLKTTVFYMEFDPAGYTRTQSIDASVPVANLVQDGLTIVKVVGVRVTAYKLYPLNMNTGTLLVFE